MSKKIFCFALCSMLFALSLPAQAQQAGNKVHRMGILRSGSPSFYVSSHEAVRQALRELGYIEGKNLLINYRYEENLTIPQEVLFRADRVIK